MVAKATTPFNKRLMLPISIMGGIISNYIFDLMGVVIGLDWRDQIVSDLQTNPKLLERMKSTYGDGIEHIIQRGLHHMELQKRADPRFNKHDPDHQRLRSLVLDIAKYEIREGHLTILLEEDVEDVFRELTDREKEIHIYTSADTEFTKLALASARRYVTHCFSAHERSELHDKYDPATFQKIATQLGKDPQQMAYISDDRKEAKAAAQAGFGRTWHLQRNLEQSKQSAEGYIIIPHLPAILEND